MKQLKFDGKLTAAQLATTIGTTENAEFIKLVGMTRETTGAMNVGDFEDVDPAADAPPELELIVVAGHSIDAPAGKTQVFDSVLYVEGKEQRVIGFR